MPTNPLPWCLVSPLQSCSQEGGLWNWHVGVQIELLFQSVLNSTISCTSQLGEVCPLLWCLDVHGQLCCTDFTPPSPSHHALWFRTVVPYKEGAGPHPLEDPSYNIIIRGLSSDALNAWKDLTRSPLLSYIPAFPKQTLLAQVTNQYEDHPQKTTVTVHFQFHRKPAPHWTDTLQNTLINRLYLVVGYNGLEADASCFRWRNISNLPNNSVNCVHQCSCRWKVIKDSSWTSLYLIDLGYLQDLAVLGHSSFLPGLQRSKW